jgi:sugar lactone lactonase YvrE
MSLCRRFAVAAAAVGAVVATGLAVAPVAQAQTGSATFLGQFSHLKTIASTVPANGDQNPYGVFVVQQSTGQLHAGNILVSNFNNSGNLQGTGSTIVQITPSGHVTVFATIDAATLPGSCPGGVGLTTALEVLPGGWVVVGSTPSTDGTLATSGAGCLIVLNRYGQVTETFSGNGINGPWDSTAVVGDGVAYLFVANVLNGTVAANGAVVDQGTILRLTLQLSAYSPPRLTHFATVGSGFAEQTSGPSFVLGPTGVGLGADDTLYVADTQDSSIHAIGHAVTRGGSTGTGRLVTQNGMLSMPLGLAIAPNGNVLTVNGGNGDIVETTPSGAQVAETLLDSSGSPPGAGALFGLAVRPDLHGVYYVDDATNTLNLLH